MRSTIAATCLFIVFNSSAHAHEEGSRTPESIMLLSIGDSLAHGTMDGTNNYVATANAFMSRIYYSLRTRAHVLYQEPYYNFDEMRLVPFRVPTNLGVDGADVFSIEGLAYRKRAGTPVTSYTSAFLADNLTPETLEDDYDKVIFPINLLTLRQMSQVDGALWLLNSWAPRYDIDRAVCVLWIGNNDSSTAALGAGGARPEVQPVPLWQVALEIDPGLFWLMLFGSLVGEVSFEPYALELIERNLTDLDEFAAQYERVVARLRAESAGSGVDMDLLALTLPYYTAVGYLFDSEDIEFYLRKLNPSYSVPPSFKQAVLPDQPLAGDRISLLTFGFMYGLLESGYSVAHVNSILEIGGVQQDGLVLSEAEAALVMERIDGYNAVIRSVADAHGDAVHLVDIGQYLNDAFLNKIDVRVGDRLLSRKWVRGSGLSLDGVHPNYTGQSLIANFVLEAMGETLDLELPLYDLAAVAGQDPYIDLDGDGWAPGPSWSAPGTAELLHFFTDADDTSPSVGVELPEDFWPQISSLLLERIIGTPAMAAWANALGLEVPAR